MLVNVSQIETFQECPRKWYYQYHLKRGYDIQTEAMRLGLRYHAILAGEEFIASQDPRWMHEASEAFHGWVKEHNVDIIARELEIACPVGYGFKVCGRLDTLAIWNDKVWHIQHKSWSPQLIDRGIKAQRISLHEGVYRAIVEKLKPVPDKPYGGTILAIAIKGTKPPFFRVEYLPIRSDFILDDIRIYAARCEYDAAMVKATEGVSGTIPGFLPLRNRRACHRFGDCQYLPVCFEMKTIESYPEHDPMEKYNAIK